MLPTSRHPILLGTYTITSVFEKNIHDCLRLLDINVFVLFSTIMQSINNAIFEYNLRKIPHVPGHVTHTFFESQVDRSLVFKAG